MKKRFTEEQIIVFLKEAEAGVPVEELCRKHGFSDASFYTWRSKFGGMEVSDAKRLKAMEQENARLKKLLAETINGLYKAELIHRRAPWKSRESVELATLQWVHWFNYERLLAPIGHIPPAEAEANYWRELAREEVAYAA